MKNIIDSIVLTPAVMQVWHRAAQAAALVPGIDPGEEEAYEQEDGSLKISCSLGQDKTLELIIPPDQWAWMD